MSSICWYFQVHQPYRVKRYRVQDIGEDHDYFNDQGTSSLHNRQVLEKVAAKCYRPANSLFLKLLAEHSALRLSYSFSGILLEQLEAWAPDVIEQFQALIATGQVEILAETSHHSLASLYSNEEFLAQVQLHQAKIERLFGVTPRVFRNTELIYSDDIARTVATAGYRGMLTEGVDRILGWRSPGHVYSSPGEPSLPVLLKNYQLSDDIAFRFSDRSWAGYPLTSQTFARWAGEAARSSELINLFMDYETFGEHQWEDTGIFSFLEALPDALLGTGVLDFATPSEALDRYQPAGTFSSESPVSWADVERDLSAWRSNQLQATALQAIYALEPRIRVLADESLLADWRRLQTSDHFYYMCTKWFADGDVHKYFNPYESPYEAYIAFMNARADLELRVSRAEAVQEPAMVQLPQALEG